MSSPARKPETCSLLMRRRTLSGAGSQRRDGLRRYIFAEGG